MARPVPGRSMEVGRIQKGPTPWAGLARFPGVGRFVWNNVAALSVVRQTRGMETAPTEYVRRTLLLG